MIKGHIGLMVCFFFLGRRGCSSRPVIFAIGHHLGGLFTAKIHIRSGWNSYDPLIRTKLVFNAAHVDFCNITKHDQEPWH